MTKSYYLIRKIAWGTVHGPIRTVSLMDNFIGFNLTIAPSVFLVEEENNNEIILIEKLKGNIVGKINVDLDYFNEKRCYYDLFLRDYLTNDQAYSRAETYSINGIKYKWN